MKNRPVHWRTGRFVVIGSAWGAVIHFAWANDTAVCPHYPA